MEGRLHTDGLDSVIETSQRGCLQIYKECDEIMRKYATNQFKSR